VNEASRGKYRRYGYVMNPNERQFVKRKVAALTIVAGTLTACGGATAPPSVAALGQKLGCFSAPVVSPPPNELFTRETATCDFSMPDQSSQSATLYTFATAEAQANWTKMANAYGGVRVDGKLWTVALDGQVAGATAQKRLGGVLK
jgi:hypothetical protein